MKNLLNEQQLKALTEMAKNFEAQIREQSETSRKIAMDCEELVSKQKNKQQAK